MSELSGWIGTSDEMADPEVLRLWRDYRHVTQHGNPFGISFARYIAMRLAPPEPIASNSTGPLFAAPASESAEAAE